MICTFFGDRDIPYNFETLVKKEICKLIECYDVDTFYVGNQGAFDAMVIRILKDIKEIYPHVSYTVVLAFPLYKNIPYSFNTLYPDVLKNVPEEYAISRRNRWMLEKSHYVITYIPHNYGKAWIAKCIADATGKNIIELSQ